MHGGDLVSYFLWLGTTGFGGPIALVGHMQRDLVERRQWFTPEEYREGLALAQLALATLAVLWRAKRLPEPVLIVLAGMVGVAVQGVWR